MHAQKISSKLWYFAGLLILGFWATYLLHGFMIRDLIITSLVCVYMIWKPDTFLFSAKLDKYSLVGSLPTYIFTALIAATGIVVGNYIGYVHLKGSIMIELIILMSLFIPIVDLSRYS